MPPLVYPPKHYRYNDTHSQTVRWGFGSEMLKVNGNAYNVSLDIASGGEVVGVVIGAGARRLKELKANHFYLLDGFQL